MKVTRGRLRNINRHDYLDIFHNMADLSYIYIYRQVYSNQKVYWLIGDLHYSKIFAALTNEHKMRGTIQKQTDQPLAIILILTS